MSSTVLVSQQIRQALRALPFSGRPRLHSHSYSNPPTPAPFQTPVVAPTRTPPVLTRALPNVNPTNRNGHSPPSVVPKQLLPRDFIAYLQSAAKRAHVSSTLSLYLSDLFSAVRHHPKLDGTFLTARSVNDAKALTRAGRIFGTDPTGGELLRDQHGVVPFEDDEHYSDSHTSFHEYDDIASGSGSVTIIPRGKNSSLSHLVSIKHREPTLATLADTPPHDPVETLFVSEADIARIVPRVVTHRLRVRDGPEDELLGGAMFGATFEPQAQSGSAPDYDWDTRSTVKDILVEILAQV
ncbi:hypothetical protein DXG03_002232 [Asterophora parasitica]|uniref:Uncharacterized protein n=1 Tax=Asterophora parasitica TaxID=117018 RepID=A0A9P7KCD1_9AGAR|nr:hypothetical protein DXG03_002232 [Asterophora parasitica]